MEGTIQISIGGSPNANTSPEPTYWHVRETDAPKEYDGFGTFAVAEYDDKRVVLIRDEHYNWQYGRYGSGLHSCTETNFDMADVAELLWKRLLGKS